MAAAPLNTFPKALSSSPSVAQRAGCEFDLLRRNLLEAFALHAFLRRMINQGPGRFIVISPGSSVTTGGFRPPDPAYAYLVQYSGPRGTYQGFERFDVQSNRSEHKMRSANHTILAEGRERDDEDSGGQRVKSPGAGANRESMPEGFDDFEISLVLSGGNALGAYHLGACEVLLGAGWEPGWLVGASIGAVTATILAGNEPSQRLERLRSFWTLAQQTDLAPMWSVP